MKKLGLLLILIAFLLGCGTAAQKEIFRTELVTNFCDVGLPWARTTVRRAAHVVPQNSAPNSAS